MAAEFSVISHDNVLIININSQQLPLYLVINGMTFNFQIMEVQVPGSNNIIISRSFSNIIEVNR